VSPTVAAVVANTAYGSATAAGLVSPALAAKASAMGRMATAVSCDPLALTKEWPEPIPFLYTSELSFVGPGAEAPEGTLERRFAHARTGAVLCTALLLPAAVGVWLGTRQNPLPQWQRSLVTALFFVQVTYLGPSVTEVSVTALVHGAEGLEWFVAALVINVMVNALILFFLARRFDAAAATAHTYSPPASNGQQSNAADAGDGGAAAPVPAATNAGNTGGAAASPRWTKLQIQLAAMWDAARDFHSVPVRLLVWEDVVVAHLIAILTGIRPSTMGPCRGVGTAMCVVAALHLLYLCWWRPYAAKPELYVAGALGALQQLFATAVTVSTWVGPQSRQRALQAVGAIQLGYDVVMWGSLFYFAYQAWKGDWRKLRAKHHAPADAAAAAGGLTRPLITTRAGGSRGAARPDDADSGQPMLTLQAHDQGGGAAAPANPLAAGARHDGDKAADQQHPRRQQPQP